MVPSTFKHGEQTVSLVGGHFIFAETVNEERPAVNPVVSVISSGSITFFLCLCSGVSSFYFMKL